MKPRKRSISNLYHRWGKHHELNSLEVAQALFDAGLIQFVYVHFHDHPSHYVETLIARAIPEHEFELTIEAVLRRYRGQP